MSRQGNLHGWGREGAPARYGVGAQGVFFYPMKHSKTDCASDWHTKKSLGYML